MYAPIRLAFGWEVCRRDFAEERDLPASERTKTDADKRGQWLTRMSKAAGRNLRPFFEAWGEPAAKGARGPIRPPGCPARCLARNAMRGPHYARA